MKKVISILALIVFSAYNVYACFDTYLFLKKSSLVYPHKSLVFELNGEYSINKINNPYEDSFLSNGNLYYGIAERFSMQFSLGSGEKSRDVFKLDNLGIRGVYNLFSSLNKNFTTDLILEYHGEFSDLLGDFEFSVPNIFRFSEITYIIHPTLNYNLSDKNFQVGGHTGVFYNFNDNGIIGIGAEYLSPQSSSYSGNRVTKSEFATSLFFGAHIGNKIFIQNEIAKGLANSRDFGFAVTLKFIR